MNKINDQAGKMIHIIAAEKKKSVLAAGLVTLMIFMWVRVFLNQGPEGVEAAEMQDMLVEEQQNSSVKVSFIDLPYIQGRHDNLARDIFSWNQWQGSQNDKRNLQNREKVDVLSEEGKEGVIRRIAGQLQLEAIELGKKPRIFLNDEFLSKGDKIRIEAGNENYECEVISIQQEGVLIQCGQSQIRLRLAEAIEVLDSKR